MVPCVLGRCLEWVVGWGRSETHPCLNWIFIFLKRGPSMPPPWVGSPPHELHPNPAPISECRWSAWSHFRQPSHHGHHHQWCRRYGTQTIPKGHLLTISEIRRQELPGSASAGKTRGGDTFFTILHSSRNDRESQTYLLWSYKKMLATR